MERYRHVTVTTWNAYKRRETKKRRGITLKWLTVTAVWSSSSLSFSKCLSEVLFSLGLHSEQSMTPSVCHFSCDIGPTEVPISTFHLSEHSFSRNTRAQRLNMDIMREKHSFQMWKHARTIRRRGRRAAYDHVRITATILCSFVHHITSSCFHERLPISSCSNEKSSSLVDN